MFDRATTTGGTYRMECQRRAGTNVRFRLAAACQNAMGYIRWRTIGDIRASDFEARKPTFVPQSHGLRTQPLQPPDAICRTTRFVSSGVCRHDLAPHALTITERTAFGAIIAL